MPRTAKHTPLNERPEIDSRDLVARLAELRAEYDALDAALNDALTATPPNHAAVRRAKAAISRWQQEGCQWECMDLADACAEGELYPDWGRGGVLVREDAFVDHIKAQAEAVHGDSLNRWPYTHIDWEEATDACRSEYAEIRLYGTTYLLRA